MQCRVFGTVLGGLVVASMLFLGGCEEIVDDKPTPKPDKPAQLYKEADLAAIKSRWRGFSLGGSGSSPHSTMQARATADVADAYAYEGIPGLAVDDARAYGACEVFSARFQVFPLWPEGIADLVFFDCIDRVEQEPGHFHVAAMCNGEVEPATFAPNDRTTYELAATPKQANWIFVRAGDRERTVPDPEHTQQTVARHRVAPRSTIATIGAEARWLSYVEAVNNYDGGGVTVIRWAVGQEEAMHDLILDAAKGARLLSFSISHDPEPGNSDDTDIITDTGIANITANDAAAVDEYQRRCAALPG